MALKTEIEDGQVLIQLCVLQSDALDSDHFSVDVEVLDDEQLVDQLAGVWLLLLGLLSPRLHLLHGLLAQVRAAALSYIEDHLGARALELLVPPQQSPQVVEEDALLLLLFSLARQNS